MFQPESQIGGKDDIVSNDSYAEVYINGDKVQTGS